MLNHRSYLDSEKLDDAFISNTKSDSHSDSFCILLLILRGGLEEDSMV